ncbi:hypothetical protein P1X14_00230 [Sphingomonas sp. AOB5]|uniref:hypothetical protein n=1 Tax=Sphingomonas sp. AOB5 TaxID=3034017 RepID=UPI0023F841B0|nr:hypothetical protein [Sphingomonas sp. AOB5]MDF7773658.1 hypothetical protein [Sphingomonas sp. AOB5]
MKFNYLGRNPGVRELFRLVTATQEDSVASTGIDIEPEANEGSAPDGAANRLVEQVKGQAGGLSELAFAKAGEFADGRKQDAVQKLGIVVEVIRDLADGAGDQFGSGVGGLVHRGGDVVETVAQSLDRQSVGDMVDGARSLITRHPGVAIGVASIAGLLIGRIAKAGMRQPVAGKVPFEMEAAA